MGQIEKILTAANLLIVGTPRQWIRYYVKMEKMVFLTSFGWDSIGSIFICFTMNEGPCFFYVVNPKLSYYQEISDTLWKNTIVLSEKEERIIFSGMNVFKYLQLGEPFDKSSNDHLENLRRLCTRIMETKQIVSDAFTKNKIEKTYYALSAMDGNDEDEINLLLKDLYLDML